MVGLSAKRKAVGLMKEKFAISERRACLVEYSIRKDERSPFKFKYKAIRFVAYALVILGMLLFYDSNIDRSFIYFQF